MLMLSRKVNESIVIGDDVRVTVTRIGRGRVQIAIEAPRDVRIRRDELPLGLGLPQLGQRRSPVGSLAACLPAMS